MESFKKDLIIRLFILIGIIFVVITLIYFNSNIGDSKSLYLMILFLLIGLGFLIGALFLIIKLIRSGKKSRTLTGDRITTNRSVTDIHFQMNENIGIEDNFDTIKEINQLIIKWGKQILDCYLKFYNAAIRIYPDLKESLFKFEVPYFRIDLYWKYNLKDIEIEFKKIITSNKRSSGIFLHESKEDLYLEQDQVVHDSRSIEVTDFPFSLKNMKKLLNYHSAEKQAIYLINNDLREHSEKKGHSFDIILKKYWTGFETNPD